MANKKREEPWVEKYRPKRLNQFVGQVEVIKKITPMIEKGELRNMTFYGETPGTGKTSLAHTIGHELFGGEYNFCVTEFNASDNTSVDFVRTELKEIISYQVMGGRDYRLMIVDEADGWGKAAQQACRRIIEDSQRNTRWILVANRLNKIIPPLQSRCPPVFFAPLPVRDMITKLQEIVEKEGLKCENGVLKKIAEYSGGSLREAIATLDILHFKRRKVMIKDIETGQTGLGKIVEMYSQAKKGRFVTARKTAIDIMKEFGLSISTIIEKLEPIVINDDISPPRKAKIVSEMAKSNLALSSTPSELLELSGLFARVALVMKGGKN